MTIYICHTLGLHFVSELGAVIVASNKDEARKQLHKELRKRGCRINRLYINKIQLHRVKRNENTVTLIGNQDVIPINKREDDSFCY